MTSSQQERPVAKAVTFGEVLLRLSPPGHERLLQSPILHSAFGGSEANVAVSLAQFGIASYHVTRLPTNALGDAALGALRAEGVCTDYVLRGGDRLGLYFAEVGAGQRPSTVLYDRAHSAVTELKPGMVLWRDVFAGAAWFHVSGITPALGPDVAACTREALEAARAAEVRTSLDLNFRRSLWSEREAQLVIRPLVALVDVLVANEEHLRSLLGVSLAAGASETEGYRRAAEEIRRNFGVSQLVLTVRRDLSASESDWGAVLLDRGGEDFYASPRYSTPVVDRIGVGDAFTAGLIYGTLTGRSPKETLRFAMASGVLKQTIPGDMNRVSVEEVEQLLSGEGGGRLHR